MVIAVCKLLCMGELPLDFVTYILCKHGAKQSIQSSRRTYRHVDPLRTSQTFSYILITYESMEQEHVGTVPQSKDNRWRNLFTNTYVHIYVPRTPIYNDKDIGCESNG